jgi:DNA-binding response OmpR family regulator
MSDSSAAAPTEPEVRTHSVVVYSDDAAVRDQVRTALGRRPAPDLGRVEWMECSTGEQVISAVDDGDVDLVVLDGEAWPTGGLGLAKQMKDELRDCPHTLVLIARRDDQWLATWSLADAVTSHPVDPAVLTEKVAELLRARESALPVRRAVPLGR